MIIPRSYLANNLILQSFNEARQPLLFVWSNIQAELTMLVASHSVDMTTRTQHSGMTEPTTHRFYNRIKAAYLGQINKGDFTMPRLTLIKGKCSKAQLS